MFFFFYLVIIRVVFISVSFLFRWSRMYKTTIKMVIFSISPTTCCTLEETKLCFSLFRVFYTALIDENRHLNEVTS